LISYMNNAFVGLPISFFYENVKFFLLNNDKNGSGAKPWPDLPRDTIAGRGFEGQALVIIPSKNMVIVRFGLTRPRSAWNMNDYVKEIIARM